MLRRFFFLSVMVLMRTIPITFAQTCPGGSGCQDPSFGSGGEVIVSSPANQVPRQMVLQPDNKIVGLMGVNVANSVAGYLIRMDADGTQFDSTFGTAGLVTLTWGGASGRVFGLGKQLIGGEERFVVAGWVPCGRKTCIRVERYTSTGTLDTTFGNSGVTIISNENFPFDITVLPDQRLLLTGSVSAMLRLTANGSLDPTFGSNGVSTAISVLGQVRGPAVLFPSGRFVVPGSKSIKGGTVLAVARFNSNGSLDNGGKGDSTPGDSLGSAGVATLTLPTPCFANAIALDANGNIVVAGVRGSLPAFTVRFSPNGQLDNGYSINDLTGLAASYFMSIVMQNDGKMVISGEGASVSGMPSDALVARYNSDGSVDTTFGNNGWILKDYYGVPNVAVNVLMQPDISCFGCEKILVNGSANLTQNPSTYEVNFIRYLP